MRYLFILNIWKLLKFPVLSIFLTYPYPVPYNPSFESLTSQGFVCWHWRSQNQRMSEFGRDLWRPSGPIPLLKQSHLDRLPRTMHRWCLNISRAGDSITSLCNLWQWSVILTVKKCFVMFRWNRQRCWISYLQCLKTVKMKPK